MNRDVRIASGHGSRQTPLKERLLLIHTRGYPAPVWRESERFLPSKIFLAGENCAVGAKHNAEVTLIWHSTFYHYIEKFILPERA